MEIFDRLSEMQSSDSVLSRERSLSVIWERRRAGSVPVA